MEDPISAIQRMHPIIGGSPKKVFWSDKIYYTEKGKKISSYCVLANTGFYVFRTKGFPVGYSVHHHISLKRLNHVVVTASNIQIKMGKKHTLEICCEKNVELGATINALIVKLFGKMDISVSTEINNQFNDYKPELNIKSCLADRFISFAAEVITQQYVDLAQDLYKKLEDSPKSLTITPEIATSIFIDALVESISYDIDLTHLKLQKLTMGSFCPHLSKIFKQSYSIDQLSLIDFSFAGYSHASEVLFSDACVMPLKTLKFIRSELNRPEFVLFVSEFTTYKGDITTLHIDSCLFDESTIDNLFVSFFDADCFRNLESFSLTGGNIPERVETLYVQLLGSNWIEKHQKLNTISAMNTGINSELIVPVLSLLPNNVISINFTGCKFLNPILINPPPFQTLDEIDFTNNEFTAESLKSFFKAIAANPQAQPRTIILNSIKISNGMSDVISSIKGIKLKCVEKFSFDNNLLFDSDIDNFTKFIYNISNLKVLCISNTLPGSSKKSINFLNQIAKSTKLERITVCGDGATKFGPSFVSALKSILKIPSLKAIDISGQGIGDEGILLLRKFIEKKKSIKELSFDSTKFDDMKKYVEFLDIVSKSPIDYSAWPKVDSDEILKKAESRNDKFVVAKINELRIQFITKFGEVNQQNAKLYHLSNSVKTLRERTTSLISYDPNAVNQADDDEEGYDLVTEIKDETYESLKIKEPIIIDMLKECYDIKDASNDDILVKTLDFVLSETSISRIIS